MVQRLSRSFELAQVRRILLVFLCLQLLDMLTTVIGLRFGAGESSFFVARLLRFGPMPGLLLSKAFALFFALTALSYNRQRLIRFVNFWFAGVVAWNLLVVLRLTHSFHSEFAALRF